MSHTIKRGRGRPRAYDPEFVLSAARDAFWSRGLEGVSLDQISEATGVARPSLAAAFGDKRALYLRTIDAFTSEMQKAARETLSGREGLRAELAAFFKSAVDLYVMDGAPRGCMALCTLPVGATDDPELRARLSDVITATDALFAARFRLARTRREVPAEVSVATHGALASALLHSVALRARSGASKASLQTMIRSALGVLCGPST